MEEGSAISEGNLKRILMPPPGTGVGWRSVFPGVTVLPPAKPLWGGRASGRKESHGQFSQEMVKPPASKVDRGLTDEHEGGHPCGQETRGST